MSEGETFLARWSRLKREQQAAAPSPADSGSPPDISETASVATPSAVDRADLPAIESLGAGSDVSPFLSAGVAPELTQAALRNAWRADPAVRDFVEIADNQWDFNEAEAMPGFGALGATDQARTLVTQALSILDDTVAPVVSPPATAATPTQQVTTLQESRVVDPVWQAGATIATQHECPSPPEPGKSSVSDASAPPRRLHGSALPK